jgi:hypothetical protein
MNLSTADLRNYRTEFHETWWSYRYMFLVDPKVFSVSIIIQLEVININVRNFKFPIGFYSNPHPPWTLKNMALTPFTTNLKTLGSNNFYRSPFSKWTPQYHTNSTLSDFNEISYLGRLWCPELIPDIEKFLAVAIFKMSTAQIQHCYLSMSGINSWHHNLLTYEMALKSDNVEFVRYCGDHFENDDR